LVWILSGFLATGAAVFVASQLAARFLHGPGARQRANLLFNLFIKMTLPWQVFLLIPVLGWVLAPLGALLSVWKVLALLFPQHSPGRRLAAGLVVPGLAATATNLLSSALLAHLLWPLSRLGL
jgi:hypothetical protein